MKAIYIDDKYYESATEEIYGREIKLEKERKRLRKEGFYFFSGGDSVEIWKRDTHCYVTYKVGNKIFTRDFQNEVISFFNLLQLYESRFYSLCDDWRTGKIEVDCNEDGTILSISYVKEQ